MIIIQQLHIYGFGKHINEVISLQPGMNIFYGENEAGKTTIQQFILQIFFGFPAKNSTLAKYEPKTSARFGGLITLQHPKYGLCQIERVKGKAGGEVTVRLEDGTIGHEEFLAKLLYGYSRVAFEAIFAFSLHELQGIERMSEEELSRVLLASGTTGVEQLTKLERKLEKEMGELYKKSGKNPIINQRLEQLKQTERQLQLHQQKIAGFDGEMARLKEIEQAISLKQQQQQLLQEQWRGLTKMQQALPLLLEQRLLERELETLMIREFPTDGIRRFEQIKDRQQHFQAKLDQLMEQQHVLEEQFAAQFDMESYKGLQQLLDKESEWYQLNASMKALQQDIELLVLEIDNHFRLLGIDNPSERQQVSSQNVSIQQEERFLEILSALEQLEERQKVQILTVERVRDELEEIENRLRHSKQEQPADEERQLLQEWPIQQQRLEQLKAQEQASKQGEAVSYRMSLLLLVLSVATLFFGLWQKNWPVLIVGVVLLITGVQFFRMAQSTRQTKLQASNLRKILHEMRELEQQAIHIDSLKERIQRYDDRVQSFQEQHHSKLSQYKQLEQTLTQLELEQADCWRELERFLSSFYISGVTQRKLLPELFTRVREIQRLSLLTISKQELLSNAQTQQLQLINLATQLTKKACTVETIYVHVRHVFQQLEQQKSKSASLEKQLAEIQQQLSLEQSEYTILQRNIAELFKQANVTDEATFYLAEESYILYKDKNARLQFVNNQLTSIEPPVMDELPTTEFIQQQLRQLEEKQGEIQNSLEQLLSEKAALQFSTHTLLTDEQYGRLLQVFEQQRAELAEYVEKWSSQKAILISIEKVMTVLREEKLPKVLVLVNNLFTLLTGGRYKQLSINTQGDFEALAEDGMRYHVAELSQATKEQAYVALRFALAQSLIESAPFPFIMDDPFVHFDRNRLSYMIQLMQEIQQERQSISSDSKRQRQMLYFTCHPILKHEYDNAHVIQLN